MPDDAAKQSSLVLASASPRRRQLLSNAGLSDIHIVRPHVDDGLLRKPAALLPEAWVMALAWLKARSVAELLGDKSEQVVILAADTVCIENDGTVLGQPSNEKIAKDMLLQLRGAMHRTMTGVCLLSHHAGSATRLRTLLYDVTRVEVGHISIAEIDRYVASGDWQGKAGGYNLQERLDGDWPIKVIGDPTTVMGLPMEKLKPLLQHRSDVARSKT